MYEYNDEDGGIQFQPYDDELINQYLIPKLKGKPCREITMKDVYSKEPWLLDHPMGSFFKKNEWYYFVTRTQLSKKKIGCGKKVKRKITRDDDSGSWRANAKEDITDKETKKTIGVKQSLNFVRSNVNNKKQKREDGTSCDVSRDNESWIMTEYMLPEEKDKFHELVICKIHVIKNSKKENDDHHEACTSSNHHHYVSVLASSFSDQQLQHPINEAHRHEASTYHHHPIEFYTLEQQPINIVYQETFLAPILEQQPINIVDQETFLSPFLEQQPTNIVDQEVFLSPFLAVQQTNIFDQENFLSPFLREQPTNIACNIQENNKDDHEALIPYHHHEFAADCYTEQQPINEFHGHVPKIPLIGSELINSLATVNVSSLPMEEDDGILNYDAQFIYQDLLESVCYPPPPPPRKL
ncbi:PREDICTED: NAC domain-containing protein 78-like [Brassica oleracea var. oleracea]|uniref:NAC domain-containing protein n=2 Tax=Brassica oleracea TaxID=3712 RepID=A0A0D3ECL7_BRAOL|nr:PREDICTED: NAC domain-containing protein 78-like [Brassica oleracea var. oleracea]